MRVLSSFQLRVAGGMGTWLTILVPDVNGEEYGSGPDRVTIRMSK